MVDIFTPFFQLGAHVQRGITGGQTFDEYGANVQRGIAGGRTFGEVAHSAQQAANVAAWATRRTFGIPNLYLAAGGALALIVLLRR